MGDLVAIFGPFGLILGHLAVVLGRLGLSWAVLGPSWDRFGENPEPCWSAAWSFTSRLLGMECGRCYPAGVSIRPHDEVDAGTVLNQIISFQEGFPGAPPPPRLLRQMRGASPKIVKNVCVFVGFRSFSLLNASFSSSSSYLSHLRAQEAVLGPSWAVLGPSWAVLGRLGPSWGRLGASWVVLGRFWCRLGAVLGRLGGVLGRLGGQDPARARRPRVLEASWGCLGLIFGRFLGDLWDEISIIFLPYP